MKILLLNDNPVVTKLVTLSSQKTSDELEIVESVEEIEEGNYDLFAIDDALYTKEILDEIKSKIKYIRSLYICSRDAEDVEEFTSILKKPFLPTDLVELLVEIEKEVEADDTKGDELGVDDDLELDLDGLDLDDISLDGEDSKDSLDDMDLDLDSLDLDDISLDEEDSSESSDDLDLSLDDISLDGDDSSDDEDLSLDDISLEDDEEFKDSVLDKEELQEVQELLDETDEDVDDISLDEDLGDEVAAQDNIQEEDELSLDDGSIDLDDNIEDKSEDELELDIDLDDESGEDKTQNDLELDMDLDELDEVEDENLGLEDDIQNAVSELSEDDLDMPVNEVAGLDSLTQKDIKLAIGEDVLDEDEIESEDTVEDDEISQIQESSDSNGVDVLKKLLEVLSDEGIESSLDGKKIEIKITIGDK